MRFKKRLSMLLAVMLLLSGMANAMSVSAGSIMEDYSAVSETDREEASKQEGTGLFTVSGGDGISMEDPGAVGNEAAEPGDASGGLAASLRMEA